MNKRILSSKVDDVWTPETEFLNADFPSIHQMIPSLKICRQSAPLADDTSRHLRGLE